MFSLSNDQRLSILPYVDVVLITSDGAGHTAVKAALQPFPGFAEPVVFTDIWFYTLGLLGRYAVAHVKSRGGGTGIHGAGKATAHALATWDPKIVLMPGIAYGLRENEQALGDLLMAERILDAGHRKIVGETWEHRGSVTPVDSHLWNLFWNTALHHDIPHHQGALISEDVLCRSAAYRAQLEETFPDAIGGEMEGYAVLEEIYAWNYAHRCHKAFMLVKGISDWGDESKSDLPQKQAAEASVNLCRLVLEDTNALDRFAIVPFARCRMDIEAVLRSEQPRSFDLGEQAPRHGQGIRRASGSDTRFAYSEASNPDRWKRELLDPDEHTPILVITGPSGRGKSFAAKQLRQDLAREDRGSLHFWLDCSAYTPRREILAELFARALPATEQARFKRDFPYTFGTSSASGFDFMTELRQGHAPAAHCYLYLDDLDHQKLEMQSPKSFLHGFLQSVPSLPGLRIIVTSKDEQIGAILDAMLQAAGHTDCKAVSLELEPLRMEHSREYLNAQGVLSLLDFDRQGELLKALQGEPLSLRLVADILRTIEREGEPSSATERKTQLLLEIIAHYESDQRHSADKTLLHSDIRGLLFRYQLGRLPPNVYTLALAIAVLTYGYPPDALSDTQLLRAVTDMSDVSSAWDLLRRYRIATGDAYRLDLDAARDFLYEAGRRQDDREAHRRQVQGMHLKAAAFYEQQPTDHPDLAAWHYAQGRDYERALALLNEFSPDFEASFRFAALKALRQSVRDGMVSALYDTAARADNDAQLAEVEYQGYDACELEGAAWALAAKVVINYHEPALSILQTQYEQNPALKATYAPPAYRHANAAAYAQANAMLTINAFETPISATPSADWRSLTTAGQDLVRFAESHLKDGAFHAALLSNLGVFYNRGAGIPENIDRAIAAYDRALKALKQAEAGLSPSKRHLLQRDRLRIGVNYSRSLFLAESGGPQQGLDALQAAHPGAAEAGSQEQIYGTVNACYYLLARGKIDEAAKRIEDVAIYRERLQGQADTYIFDYVQAVKHAICLYRGELQAAQQGFLALSSGFDYGRDRSLMAVNASIVDLRLLLDAVASDSRSYRQATVQYYEIAERMEQAVFVGLDERHPKVDDEPIAAQTVVALLKAMPKELSRRLGKQIDDDLTVANVLTPEQILLAQAATQRRFGELMFGTTDPGPACPLQHLPVLMRGALILRSRPLTPLQQERSAT